MARIANAQCCAGCLLFCNADELSFMGKRSSSGGGRIAALFGEEDTVRVMELASPATHVTSSSPPFLMVHALLQDSTRAAER